MWPFGGLLDREHGNLITEGGAREVAFGPPALLKCTSRKEAGDEDTQSGRQPSRKQHLSVSKIHGGPQTDGLVIFCLARSPAPQRRGVGPRDSSNYKLMGSADVLFQRQRDRIMLHIHRSAVSQQE